MCCALCFTLYLRCFSLLRYHSSDNSILVSTCSSFSAIASSYPLSAANGENIFARLSMLIRGCPDISGLSMSAISLYFSFMLYFCLCLVSAYALCLLIPYVCLCLMSAYALCPPICEFLSIVIAPSSRFVPLRIAFFPNLF